MSEIDFNSPAFREAQNLFRIVHGKGDDGSLHSFLCSNPAAFDGWLRLAQHVMALKRKSKKK